MRGQHSHDGLGQTVAMALALIAIALLAPRVALAEVGAYLEKSAETKPAATTPAAPATPAPAPATPAAQAAPAAAAPAAATAPASVVGGTAIPAATNAKVKSQDLTPPDSEEEAEDPALVKATLKLVGEGCDINVVESAVLRLPGVIDVDAESMKDHLIVSYSNTKVNPAQMGAAIKKRVADTEEKKAGIHSETPFGARMFSGLTTKGCNVTQVQ